MCCESEMSSSSSTSTTSSIVARIPSIVSAVRAAFERGTTRPVEWRYAQLRQVSDIYL
jgi:hypothetical protein